MRGLIRGFMLVVAAGIGLALPAVAQQNGEPELTATVNYVYASQLGIGTYDIAGLSVDVYTLPLGLDWNFGSDLDLEAPVRETKDWALEFNFPVSYGRFNLNASDPATGGINVTQQTLALVPGVALRAPITDNWRLRPFLDFGFGSIVTTEGHVGPQEADPPNNRFFLIYSAGVTSLYEIPMGLYTFALGNGVTFAGNSEVGTDVLAENYWAIETGVQIRRSLGFDLAKAGLSNTGVADLEPELGAYFIHYYFPNPLTFLSVEESSAGLRNTSLEVNNQFEFGVSLGSATEWELLTIRNPEIGASYIFGDGLKVFRVNFGFPF